MKWNASVKLSKMHVDALFTTCHDSLKTPKCATDQKVDAIMRCEYHWKEVKVQITAVHVYQDVMN